MTEKEAVELALEVFKYEMKAAESTTELFTQENQNNAEEAVSEAFRKVMGSVDSEQKAESAASVMQMLAQQLSSERLMRTAVEVAEESEYLTVDTEG